MIINALEEGTFEEKMMKQRKLSGLLQMEKCYVDGVGQYWYNISGKQSLDAACQIKTISEVFLEQMIHSICAELAIMEQYLLHPGGLRLEPEFVYISNTTKEFVFTIVPGMCGEIQTEFRKLMEYLLTKLDHTDEDAVRLAYSIYEKTLEDGYSIENIHEAIVDSHMEKKTDEIVVATKIEKQEKESISWDCGKEVFSYRTSVENTGHVSAFEKMINTWREWKDKICSNYRSKGDNQVVYPDEVVEDEIRQTSYPTICLNDWQQSKKGILVYEGYEQLANIQLQSNSIQIGKSVDADVIIAKDTISQFHARIEREGQEYYIEDLNSTNGTYINEQPLSYKEKRIMNVNDIIRFADVNYRFI